MAVFAWLVPQASAQQLVIGRATVDVKLENNSVNATISWFTTLASDGRVDYGTTTAYGNYIASNIISDYHEIILAGLKSETTYHFKLTSITPFGERLESFDQTFKTQKFTNKTAPAITNVRLGHVSATYMVVWWQTDELADSRVEISTDPAFKRTGFTGGNANTLEHEVVVTKLKPATTYYWRVRSRDKDKNESLAPIQQVNTVPTNQANEQELLMIRQVSPVSSPDPAITDTAVTFTWKTTRLARGRVELRGIKASGKRVNETGYYSSDHQLTITGLKPASRYLVKIYAKDVLGKQFTTGEIDLTTDPVKPAQPVQPPKVSGVGCHGPYVYGAPCRDLNAERKLAGELREYLINVFRGRVPAGARENWFTLVNAYAYGGYPTEALVAAVRNGGKTVHPKILWEEWKNSPDYQAYIKK